MSLAATLALNVPAITALCTGPRGPQGATIFTGSGVPLTANGLVGDIYIDVQNSYLYGPKPLSSSWGSAQTLTAATTAITTYIPSVLSAYNFVTYTNYYSGAPLTYASTGQDITYTPLTLMGYTSSYLQSYIQNFSPTISASTDFVVANDIGAYIDLGVNGSNYNGNLYTPKFNINGPNDSYLYNSFGNMTIGTGGGGGDFIIFTNGTLSGTHAQGGSESVRVKANGNVGINTQFPNTNLTVVGNISASSTIYSQTYNATGANNIFTVYDRSGNGRYSGLYRNGDITNLWDNTANNVISYTSGGNVGIGTTAPNQALTVVGAISSTNGATFNSQLNVIGSVSATNNITCSALTASALTVYNTISASGNIYGNTSFNYQSGTSYTLLPTDNGTVIGINNSNPVTVSTTGFTPISGYQVGILQLGTGRLTISPTPNQASGFYKTRTQYSAATLLYTGNQWILFGDVAT